MAIQFLAADTALALAAPAIGAVFSLAVPLLIALGEGARSIIVQFFGGELRRTQDEAERSNEIFLVSHADGKREVFFVPLNPNSASSEVESLKLLDQFLQKESAIIDRLKSSVNPQFKVISSTDSDIDLVAQVGGRTLGIEVINSASLAFRKVRSFRRHDLDAFVIVSAGSDFSTEISESLQAQTSFDVFSINAGHDGKIDQRIVDTVLGSRSGA